MHLKVKFSVKTLLYVLICDDLSFSPHQWSYLRWSRQTRRCI